MLSKISRKIKALNEAVGRGVAWLVVVLVVLTFYDVIMRYLFNNGSVALQELEWHLFAVILLLGAGYTLKHREHVRVDLLYASKRFSDKHRDIVDLCGNLLFLIPFCVLVIASSIPFIETAFVVAEHSPDPGGLPYRWILKSMIPLGFLLLALQGVSDCLDILDRLLKGKP